jgi:hypothetical protein
MIKQPIFATVSLASVTLFIMKLLRSLIFTLSAFLSISMSAQTYGCLDPLANNYDPLATVDNGYCCYENYLTIEASDNVLTVEFMSLQSYYSMWWPSIPNDCFPNGCVTVYANLFQDANDAWVNVYNNGELILSMTSDDYDETGGYLGFGVLYGQFTLGEVIEGCTSSYACNYNPAATCDDGSCDLSCAGCTDPTAANFDPAATINDGSCCGGENYITFNVNGAPTSADYMEFYGFGAFIPLGTGNTSGCVPDGCWNAYIYQSVFDSSDVWSLVDANGLVLAQGSPQDFSYGVPISINAIEGCPDPSACNYNPASTCYDYAQCSYACFGCTNPSAGNYDPTATIDDGSCCDVYYTIVADGPMYWNAWSYGSSGYSYGYYPDQSGFCIFDGCYNFATGSPYDYELGLNPVVNWQLLDADGNVVIAGSTQTGAAVPFSTENSVEGCQDVTACNFNPNATCANQSLCDYGCFGCTNPEANNYDSEATIDDGSCCLNDWFTIVSDVPGDWYAGPTTYSTYAYGQYPSSNGFCSFDGCGYLAFYPTDGSVYEYSISILNGNGDVVAALDVNLLEGTDYYLYFDQNVVVGCIDPYSCNYNPNANCSDYVSCDYSCYGCTDPGAPNYSPDATTDNGTCCYNSWYTVEMNTPAWWAAFDNQSGAYYSGQYPTNNGFCMSGGCFQFQAFSNDGTPVEFTIYNQNGEAEFTGTFDYDGEWVLTNTANDIVGCMDMNSCNYDPMATCNDYMICDYSCYGCTDASAPNYDPTATINNGSCCYGTWYNVTSDQPVYWYVIDANYSSSGGFSNDQTGFCASSTCLGLYVYGMSEIPSSFQVTDADGNVVLSGTASYWGYDGYDLSLGMDVAGCTYSDACNYNPDATCDNGTCQWYCGGCIDPTAMNYDASANYDDGTCIYEIELPNMGMSIVPDEENNQYYVLLSMMEVGNGAPYVLSNDYNQQFMMVEESGMVMAGPFPCDQAVEMRLNSMSLGMESIFDAAMEADCVQSVSVDEEILTNELSIFPNPATEIFTIAGLPDGIAQVDIRDISGRLVMSQQVNVAGGRIELQNQFVGGIYHIQCTVGTVQYQGRVILQ